MVKTCQNRVCIHDHTCWCCTSSCGKPDSSFISHLAANLLFCCRTHGVSLCYRHAWAAWEGQKRTDLLQTFFFKCFAILVERTPPRSCCFWMHISTVGRSGNCQVSMFVVKKVCSKRVGADNSLAALFFTIHLTIKSSS